MLGSRDENIPVEDPTEALVSVRSMSNMVDHVKRGFVVITVDWLSRFSSLSNRQKMDLQSGQTSEGRIRGERLEWLWKTLFEGKVVRF